MVRGLIFKVPQGAASLSEGSRDGARRFPLDFRNGGFLRFPSCGTCHPKVPQRCRKVPQQGGRCATLKGAPKGATLGGKWRRPPVGLLGWSK